MTGLKEIYEENLRKLADEMNKPKRKTCYADYLVEEEEDNGKDPVTDPNRIFFKTPSKDRMDLQYDGGYDIDAFGTLTLKRD